MSERERERRGSTDEDACMMKKSKKRPAKGRSVARPETGKHGSVVVCSWPTGAIRLIHFMPVDRTEVT
jgi:hypothetical protein